MTHQPVKYFVVTFRDTVTNRDFTRCSLDIPDTQSIYVMALSILDDYKIGLKPGQEVKFLTHNKAFSDDDTFTLTEYVMTFLVGGRAHVLQLTDIKERTICKPLVIPEGDTVELRYEPADYEDDIVHVYEAARDINFTVESIVHSGKTNEDFIKILVHNGFLKDVSNYSTVDLGQRNVHVLSKVDQ